MPCFVGRAERTNSKKLNKPLSEELSLSRSPPLSLKSVWFQFEFTTVVFSVPRHNTLDALWNITQTTSGARVSLIDVVIAGALHGLGTRSLRHDVWLCPYSSHLKAKNIESTENRLVTHPCKQLNLNKWWQCLKKKIQLSLIFLI